MTLLWILLFTFLGSIGAIILAALFLLFSDTIRKQIVPYLIAYATGTLLAAALLGLIPEALEELDAHEALGFVLLGIIIFFLLEKIVLWRHCHKEDCKFHGSAGPMILVGDALHNMIDGVVIAAAFLTSVPLGIAISIPVILHEIPQEVGDFAILLHSGYSRSKAFFYNILSGASSIVAGVVAYFALNHLQEALPYVMAISAASFLYVAMVDLSPALHSRPGLRHGFLQVLLILLGIMTMLLLVHQH